MPESSSGHNNFSRDFKTVNFLPFNHRLLRCLFPRMRRSCAERMRRCFCERKKQRRTSCCIAIGYHFTPIIMKRWLRATSKKILPGGKRRTQREPGGRVAQGVASRNNGEIKEREEKTRNTGHPDREKKNVPFADPRGRQILNKYIIMPACWGVFNPFPRASFRGSPVFHFFLSPFLKNESRRLSSPRANG